MSDVTQYSSALYAEKVERRGRKPDPKVRERKMLEAQDRRSSMLGSFDSACKTQYARILRGMFPDGTGKKEHYTVEELEVQLREERLGGSLNRLDQRDQLVVVEGRGIR